MNVRYNLSHMMQEYLTLLHVNNKGADQPLNMRSLISAFVFDL